MAKRRVQTTGDDGCTVKDEKFYTPPEGMRMKSCKERRMPSRGWSTKYSWFFSTKCGKRRTTYILNEQGEMLERPHHDDEKFAEMLLSKVTSLATLVYENRSDGTQRIVAALPLGGRWCVRKGAIDGHRYLELLFDGRRQVISSLNRRTISIRDRVFDS